MNAFTTRETTTFYVKVLDQHLPEALDLLSDLFHRSRLGRKEIEKAGGAQKSVWFKMTPRIWSRNFIPS